MNRFSFSFFKILILAGVLFFSASGVSAQDNGATSEEVKTPKNKKQRKADKKKEKQTESSQKLIEDAMKQHIANQTKEVRKRMKRTKKESERINNNERKPWYERMFTYKRRTKRWYQFWRK